MTTIEAAAESAVHLGRIGRRGSPSGGPRRPVRSSLSSAQIRPQPVEPPSLQWAEGGRFARLHIPAGNDQTSRGDRAAITSFTWRSRRQMLQHINAIDRAELDPACVYLATLTYPDAFPRAREAKRQLANVLKRFRRAWGPVAKFWKLEPQQRGAPHFHLLIFAATPEIAALQRDWWAHAWYEVAGQGDPNHLKFHLGQLGNRPCCEAIKSWNGVTSYAAKYIGKVVDVSKIEGWEHPGRYWGKEDYQLLPVKLRRHVLSRKAAVAIRRALGAYIEHQPTGRYRIEDPSTGRVTREWWSPAAVPKLLELGYLVRPIHRRNRRRGGGVTCFVPAEVVQQLLRWWRGHTRELEDV